MPRRTLLLILLACGRVVTGQEPDRPVFRSDPGFTVLVDIVVTDSRNRVVTDLIASDFNVFEDDVEQAIDTFELVRTFRLSGGGGGESETGPELEVLKAAAEPARSSVWERQRRNLLIFLLDFSTTEFTNQKLVEDACRKYIQENLRPGDYVAVFSLGSAFRFLQDFTNDRELLLAALRLRDISGRGLASAPSALSPAVPEGAAAEPISVSAASASGMGAAGQAAAAQGSAQADLMLAERIQNLYYTMTTFIDKREAYGVMSAIRAIARGVEEIEGRKSLVLFSQGFVVGSHMEPELEKTVNIANRANLSIYGVDSHGLATRELSSSLVPRGELSSISADRGNNRIRAVGGESLFDRARHVGSDVRDSALRYVSAATGGFAIRNTNDLYLSLQRIDEDAHTYYLLSYRPKKTEFDGQFRNIRVEVGREALNVRARNGYLAVPPGMELLNGEEFALLARLQAGENQCHLRCYFRVDTFRADSGRQQALLTVEIPAAEIEFQPDPDGRFKAELLIVGLVRAEEGRILTRFGSPVTLHATAAELDVLREGSVSFSNRFELPPGKYSFSMSAYDQNNKCAGQVETALVLEHRRQDQLELSSIVLGKEVEAGQDGEAQLMFEGARILPSAGRRFRRNDKLVYFFEIYDGGTAGGAGSGSSGYEIEVSLSRLDSHLEMRVPGYRIRGGRGNPGRVPTSRFLEIEQLSPGDYFLTATVRDPKTDRSASGRTLFHITE